MNSDPALGIYIHWPYCAKICPYCDFNVYKVREVDVEAWRDVFLRDLTYWRARTGPRKIKSIYLGGGTPSLAPLPVVEGILADIDRLWGIGTSIELTLEANPSDAELAKFSEFASLGINRLSLGVQSFDDDELKFLGRNHDAKTAQIALERALGLFERVSLDLIYGLPSDTIATVETKLKRALKFGAGHLSPYQLTIEPGTAFQKAVERKAWLPIEDDLEADLFELVQSCLADHGLPAYEVSNHARPGEESIHNLIYWYQNDYLGIGPGAHGRITIDGVRFASVATLSPDDFLKAPEAEQCCAVEKLSAESVLVEKVTMGLRMMAGFELTDDDVALLGARANRIEDLARDGLLDFSRNRLKATNRGTKVLNAVTNALLA